MEIPKGHQAVMPYLILNGASEFFAFTKRVFDAEFRFEKLRDDNKKIMHAEIMINGTTIMFADTNEQWKPATSNFFIYVSNADEFYKRALQAGATTVMEPADQSYGRSCGVTDPFGNVWWITSMMNSK